MNIEAVNNSFSNYFPTQKAAELNAGISAGINTAVNGGSLKDNLGNAALGALVNSFQGEAASKIKTTFSDDYVAKQFAHALAGCVSGLVQGKCKDGAIGAAVGEIVAESILGGRNPATLSDAEKHKVISYSKIIAGSVAALNGGDVNTAANAAEVAVVNNALNFDSTPTNAKKHQPQKPDKTALEKIIQSIMPAHAAGAMTNPQDKDAAIWISNIRNGITGPIVITSYGVYAAGWTAPLIGTAGKLAISTCMANPSGCTVMVTQAAEAGAGIATGAVTVGNAWEAPVGALSKAKAAKQAAPKETINNLANLAKAEQQILFRIAQRDTQLDAWKTGFNNRVRKGAGLLDASNIPITINGKTIKPVQAISLKGAPVYSGVSEQEIFALYRQMTGQNPNFRVLPDGRLANGIISTGEWAGTKIALRNFSKTENSTQARWTLDLQNPPSFIKGTKLELKFQ
ncbi:putative hemagglutinin [Neisseria meningitidis]|nr:putative hemagglutinin [Neisseria meningitidis]